MFVPVLFLASTIQGKGNLVGGVKSKISVNYDGQSASFSTYKSNVEDALLEQGIVTYPQDSFSIPRETALYGQTLEIKINKSLPVIIWDEHKRILGRSSSDVLEQILIQNKVKVWPEDKISSSLIFDPIKNQGVGQVVNIKRAPLFRVHADGNISEIRSWGKTTEEVLKDKIPVGKRDIIEPLLKSPAIAGDIKITRINVVEVEETVPVPYQTVYKEDFFVPAGVEKVTESGSNGSKNRLVRIRYKNGKEENRTILSESIIEKPKSRVIKKGLMPSNQWDFKRAYWDQMVAAGKKYGISPLALYDVASCESHLNPNSVNPAGYYGMYQYNLGFWQTASQAAGFSGVSWKDARAQIYSTARYASKYGWGRWGCKP